jgi:hypothetical protein
MNYCIPQLGDLLALRYAILRPEAEMRRQKRHRRSREFGRMATNRQLEQYRSVGSKQQLEMPRRLSCSYISFKGLMYCTSDVICAGMRRCAGNAPHAVSHAKPACRLPARTRNDRIAQVLPSATASRPLSSKFHAIAGDYILRILIPSSTQAPAAMRGEGREIGFDSIPFLGKYR